MNAPPETTQFNTETAPIPLPRNLVEWLTVFGPGAVIASLTIGTGELIFSTRGGALFGYRILFLFVIISVLKWGLVVATSRHIVMTGVHPYQRMMELPGPRGWFPAMLLLMAAICMPIWVSFHSSVLGNLTAWITGTQGKLGGGVDYLWGAGILSGVLVLTATGGYSALERIQLAIVAALVACAAVTLILYNPNWVELFKGAFVPQSYHYPDWLGAEYPQIAASPVWVETTRYVGVIGGAGFDYLAYTSFLREKHWGCASRGEVSQDLLGEIAGDSSHTVRRWVRAPIVDCSISFLIIVAFSAVFVTSGAMILGPNHQIPDENNLLNLQSEFVTSLHPWLLPLYVVGAFLTMLGTLYGTLEIACSIFDEMTRAVNRQFAERYARRIKLITVIWCAVGAYVILIWLFAYQSAGGEDKPRLLLSILTPANLFTGVLGCGLFCLLNLWMDWRFMPKALRMPIWLIMLNVVAAATFVGLGVKGYWDLPSRWYALGILVTMLIIGVLIAWLARRWSPSNGSLGRDT